ncbi:MAG: hypothetical protein F6K39_45210 [Okeania sp. SIO3B3]|nr:hypothetical protein [Okeania sp. SIO3B3]
MTWRTCCLDITLSQKAQNRGVSVRYLILHLARRHKTEGFRCVTLSLTHPTGLFSGDVY